MNSVHAQGLLRPAVSLRCPFQLHVTWRQGFPSSLLVDVSFPGAVVSSMHTPNLSAPGAASEVGIWQ
jgi:hypothetical protein